jgi:hypothetical protein
MSFSGGCATVKNRDLIDQWRAAADRHDSAAAAAVYRHCADQLERAADDRHPLGRTF